MPVHPTAILGPNVFFDDPASVDVRWYATLAGNNRIGQRVVIYQYANIGRGTNIEDDVYIGIRVVTTNTQDIVHGRKINAKYDPAQIKRGARIGTGAIIMPGVVIGEECLIGAGSVVTKSTDPYCVYFGVPARKIREVPEQEWLIPRTK